MFTSAKGAMRTALVGTAVLGLCACGAEPTDSRAGLEAVDASVPELEQPLEAILRTPWGQLSEKEQRWVRYVGSEITEATYLSAVSPSSERSVAVSTRESTTTGLVPGVWNLVRLPGAECADGSEYKMFVNPSVDPSVRQTKKLIVFFEPGGACWDYASCTGQAARGAVNLDGIPDNYMSLAAFLDPDRTGGSASALISPLLWNAKALGIETNRVVTDRWNKVFLPYCTGDVFSGNQVTTYADPTGSAPDVDIRHVGAVNVEIALEYLDDLFFGAEEMLVTGCSAGGAGALANYHFVREALSPGRSALLNDSGPIFPAPGRGNQYPLHQEIAMNWNVGYVIGNLESAAPRFDIRSDFGLVNEALAELHPGDRLATTLFEEDYNYSIYSYARFNGLDEDDFFDELRIKALWEEDIEALIEQYSARSNLHYFVPYYRKLNDSHCTTIINWTGTEIRTSGVEVGDFIDDLLDPSATVSSRREGFNFWDFFVTDWPAILLELLIRAGLF